MRACACACVGEDHYTQGSGSTHGEGKTVDLWDGHTLSNMTGIYSGYLYTHKAVEVIANYSTATAAAGAVHGGLFVYLAWHNTHTPLECTPPLSPDVSSLLTKVPFT